MWRRAPARLRIASPSWRSLLGFAGSDRFVVSETVFPRVCAPVSSSLHSSPFQRTHPLFSPEGSAYWFGIFLFVAVCRDTDFIYLLIEVDSVTKKTVEDVLPIATGLEREEIEADLEVRIFFGFMLLLLSL